MGYCRFETAANVLQDCVNNWDKRLSEDEELGKETIIELAKQIVKMENK